MAIQDVMYKAIIDEIDRTVEVGAEKVIVNLDKAKSVAKVLTELSIGNGSADDLTNQYIAMIKNICNQKS